jgi:hypothetical protein
MSQRFSSYQYSSSFTTAIRFGSLTISSKRDVGRFLEIAESAPEDRAAVDVWIWIVTFGFDGPEYSRAIDRLAERHTETRKVGHAALAVVYKTSPDVAKLLRAVIEKNPDRVIKGLACLAVGRHLSAIDAIVTATEAEAGAPSAVATSARQARVCRQPWIHGWNSGSSAAGKPGWLGRTRRRPAASGVAPGRRRLRPGHPDS